MKTVYRCLTECVGCPDKFRQHAGKSDQIPTLPTCTNSNSETAICTAKPHLQTPLWPNPCRNCRSYMPIFGRCSHVTVQARVVPAVSAAFGALYQTWPLKSCHNAAGGGQRQANAGNAGPRLQPGQQPVSDSGSGHASQLWSLPGIPSSFTCPPGGCGQGAPGALG